MVIRDPIHGDIALTDAERCVLDTWDVQRLRGIKQLGTANLVYPGCVHTRFDHSLGVLAVAKRIIESLRTNGHQVFEEDATIIAVSALVHDVTHVPYGHTFEDERRVFERHDKPERFIQYLARGPLATCLDSLELKDDVLAVLTKRDRGGRYPGPWRSQIVTGALDADLLDYLRRDSYFAGLSQNYDDRVFRYFSRVDGQLVLDLEKHGMERPDARSEIMHLLRMRYFLTERVYYHHAKVVAGAMISKALELALELGMSRERLYNESDTTLVAWLESLADQGDPGRAAAELARRVRCRQLFKRAYVLTEAGIGSDRKSELIAAFHQPGPLREQAERQLAQALGVSPADVIIYCPAASALKEASIPVNRRGNVSFLNAPQGPAAAEVRALEIQYRQLWRFHIFVPAELTAAAAKEAEAIFGDINELDRKGQSSNED